jgi:hypothetical protein
MAVLLTDRRLSPELAEWASARTPHVGSAGYGHCWAVGIALRGELAAVAVWHDFQPQHGTVQISLASATPRWANRHTFARVLALAFETTWGHDAVWIDKVWAAMPSDIPRTIEFNAAIGFKREATLRHHYGRGRHAVIASMMSWEFKRLYRSEKATADAERIAA